MKKHRPGYSLSSKRGFRTAQRPFLMVMMLAVPIGVAAAANEDAAALLHRAEVGSAFAGKALQESGIEPQSNLLTPIGSALKKVSRGIAEVQQRAGQNDPSIWSRMALLSRAADELQLVLQRAAYRHPALDRGSAQLLDAVRQLSQHYSRETLANNQSQPLDGRGKQALEELQRSTTEMGQVLTAIRKKAESFNDPNMRIQSADLLERLRGSGQSSETVQGLAKRIVEIDRFLALSAATSYFVDPAWRDDWKPVVVGAHALAQVTDEAREILPPVANTTFTQPITTVSTVDPAAKPSGAGSEEQIALASSEVLVYDQFIDRFAILDDENAISVATKNDGTVHVLERDDPATDEAKGGDLKGDDEKSDAPSGDNPFQRGPQPDPRTKAAAPQAEEDADGS